MKEIHAHLATSLVSFKLPVQVWNVRVCVYILSLLCHNLYFSGDTKDGFLRD